MTARVPAADALARVRSDPVNSLASPIAQVAVVAAGFDMKLPGGLTFSILIALVMIPVMVPAVRSYSMAPTIVVLSGLSIVWGWLLANVTSTSHSLSGEVAQASVFVLLSGVAALVILLWARTLVPLHRVVLLYGLGALAEGFLFGDMSWKFDLAIPTTFVVLGIAERFRSRLLAAALVTGLGIYGAINDARSIFGFCVIAAALTLWQARPTEGSGPVRRWQPALLIAALVFATYTIGSSLLTAGVFGEALQERSAAQIDASGSLIAGGRPEFAATRELVKMRPSGYGLGVVPSWKDFEAGTSGLTKINIDAGGYANNYMFGGQFNLHSVAADLWVSYGWVGVALALTMLVAIVRSMSFLVAERRAATSVLFACSLGLWYLFFGPFYSNWLEVCLAVGLALMPRSETERRARRRSGADAEVAR